MGITDAYYDLLDWLDSKGIPHFVLYLLVLVLILAVVFFLVLPLFSPTTADVVITVKADNELLKEQLIELSAGGKNLSGKTNISGIATFKVNINEKITVSVSREGFNPFLKDFTVDNSSFPISVNLTKPAPPPLTRVNLTIAKENGEMLANTEVSIKLSCSNIAVKPSPEETSTSEGSIIIEVPENCGRMNAEVSARNYQTLKVSLTAASQVIKLSAIEVPKGKVIVRINNADNTAVKDASFTVVLLDSEETEIARQETSNGIAEFPSIEKTEYHAAITDSTGKYESITTESKTLTPELSTITFVAIVKRQTKGFLNLRVVNAENNERVANATIKIFNSAGKSVIAPLISDSNSDKNIAFFDKGTYTVQISHEDFLSFEQKIEFNNESISLTARLEKCIESLQNCGKLEALVLDEENLPVENAVVSVKNADTGFLAPVNPQITDVNGVAKFSNLKKGRYYLRAFKYPAEKDDSGNPFTLDPKNPTKQTIKIEIGKGILKVIVKDEESQAIANARVEFRTDSGRECPKPDGQACALETNVEGAAQYDFKADKKVYAIISKDDFSSFVSPALQVIKGQTVTINASLRRSIPGDKPEFNIIGVYALDGTTRQNELKAGQRYLIRLKLDIPESLNPKTAGFLLMAGNQQKGSIIENEQIYFRSVNAPGLTLVKGTTWNPTDGTDIDLDPDNLTNDDFKWVDATLANPQANTTYLIDTEIKVRESAISGQALLFNYRAWVENQSSEIIREPFDERLSTALENTEVQSLYALLKEQPFYEGKPALCEDSTGFCYYNERVYDESEGLNINEPYNLKVFQTYTLTFEISNIKEAAYGTENNPARFQLKNSEDEGATLSDNLQIIDYTFTNANNQPVSQAGLNAFELPEQQITELRQNKSIKMTIRFKPLKAQTSNFYMQIISGSNIIFTKEISFSTSAQNQLSLSASPEFLGAFITNDFNANVKDNKNVEVENATVKVTKITPDRYETTIASKKTNRLGVASFTAPSSSPGTIIRVEAEKEGYAGAKIEIKIDENILTFNPEELEASLNMKSRRTKEISTIIQSKVPIGLTVTYARVWGNFRGYLDEETMNNFIAQNIGNLVIDSGSERTLTVKAAVSPSALIDDRKTVNGFVSLRVTNAELQKTWAFNIPLTVNIDVGGTVDDTGCLNISLKDWEQ